MGAGHFVSSYNTRRGKKMNNTYLLLAEFEGHESKGKKRGSVTYSTDRENEVSKMFIISLLCVWGAQERFLFTRNGFKFLTYLESKTSIWNRF